MVLGKLWRAAGMLANSKDIPELTRYLAKNETFKKAALNSHKTTKGAFKNLENWLDNELIDPEQRKKIEE